VLFFASTVGQGLDYHLTRLAIALKRQGVNVVCIASKGEQEKGLRKELENEGIESFRCGVERVPPKKECINLVRQIVLSRKINVVHVQGISEALLAYIALRPFSRKIKIVCTFNSFPRLLTLSNPLFDIIFSKLLSRMTHLVIAPSNVVKQELIKMGIPAEKICIIYNGLELRPFSEYVSDTSRFTTLLSHSEQKKTVVYLASMLPHKGHKYVVDAIPLILRQHPNVVFIFAGGGPLKTKLKRRTCYLRVNESVFFLERIPYKYVPSLLFKSDIAIFPSLKETFGRAIIEALAAGKPVITTPVGIAPEIIGKFKVGMLVPKKDSEALANAIIKLLENPENARDMGVRGRAVVEKSFDVNIVASKIKGVYEGLV
jgi:glycosyltransferase involved in cell wall biosynthesis